MACDHIRIGLTNRSLWRARVGSPKIVEKTAF
jgi:hypothetical protein